jgi:hypothetical protein
MNTTEILSAVDSEIARLKEARALLAEEDGHSPRAKNPVTKHRPMSAEARKRIGDAQRKRWANQKNAAKSAA